MENYIWKRDVLHIPAHVDRVEMACRIVEENKAVVRLYEGRLLVEMLYPVVVPSSDVQR